MFLSSASTTTLLGMQSLGTIVQQLVLLVPVALIVQCAERPAQAEAGESAGRLRSMADEALISGKADEALQLLGRVIALEPLNERNYFKRSRVYSRLHKHSAALSDLDASLRLAPEYEVALTSRAKLLASFGRCREAVEDWRLAKQLARKDKAIAEASDGLGKAEQCASAAERATLAERRRDHRGQIEALNQLLELASSPSASLYMDRARAHYNLNDLYECIADAGRALKVDPDDTAALELRGAAYYRLAEHEMAKNHWQQALKRDPEHEGCRQGYKLVRSLAKKDAAGDDHAKMGRHTEAIKSWREAIAVDPEHGKYCHLAQLKIARSALALKEHGAAVTAADRAIELDEAAVDAHLLKCEALMNAEDFEGAVRAAKRARELRDDDTTKKMQAKAEAALKQSKTVNFYKVLGVRRDSSNKEIKKAYRDLALKHHPDKLAAEASDAEKEATVKKFQEIAQAYEVLSDDETRAKYDRGEDVTGNPQSQQQQQSPHGFPRGFQGFQHGGGRFHFHFRG